MGVNLGDVVVDGDDLLGDRVNVAARLEQLAEPGGVLVSGTAYDHLQGRLGLPLDYAGEQRVKNVARPVRAYRVRPDGWPGGSAMPWGRLRRLAAAALALLTAIGAGWWAWHSVGSPAPALPDTPSIAVLPFANPTGDARLGRPAHGMVGDLIAELGWFGLFVIARSSRFRFRGREDDTRHIGRELGVGFVVEGSLEGDGSRLRATVGLIDATSGRQVWSARYDRPLADLFAVQDEMAQRIANSLGRSEGAINRARLVQARAKPEDALQAYDLICSPAKLEMTAPKRVTRRRRISRGVRSSSTGDSRGPTCCWPPPSADRSRTVGHLGMRRWPAGSWRRRAPSSAIRTTAGLEWCCRTAMCTATSSRYPPAS